MDDSLPEDPPTWAEMGRRSGLARRAQKAQETSGVDPLVPEGSGHLPGTTSRGKRGGRKGQRIDKRAGMRERVAVAAACGWSDSEIAIALGTSVAVIQKRFIRELTTGGHAKRLAALVALYRKAEAGDVAAARECMKRPLRTDVAPRADTTAPNSHASIRTATTDAGSGTDGQATEAPGPLPVVAPREGLKAERDRVAKTAQRGSEWSDVLPRHPSVQ